MIAYLAGNIIELGLDKAIVDVNGVGYGIYFTGSDMNNLAKDDKVEVYIYEHIRENLHDLFGFLKPSTKLLFEQLVDVNGVGPRMALSVLSISSDDNVRRAIAEGDTKFISQANGVGKRAAERIVVDLKDKVGLVSTADVGDMLAKNEDEAFQALVSLGFSTIEANKALNDVDSKLTTEEKVKQALKTRK